MRPMPSTLAIGSATIAALIQTSCDPPDHEEAFNLLENRGLPSVAPLVDGNTDPADWPSYGHDLWNTRSNPVEPDHTSVFLPKIRWKIDLGGDVIATPAVVESVVYVGATNGQFAALRTATGAPVWSINLDGESITGSAAVTKKRVYVPTLAGKLWALDRKTGSTLWKADLSDGNAKATLYGSPIEIEDLVYVGVSSVEAFPSIDPITFQGSLAALDPASGDTIWRRYFATGDEDGAGVWSTPAVAGDSVFIGTGQAYTEPVSPYIDSMISLNAGSGVIQWHRTWWPDDIFIFLDPEGTDYDFGASPNLFWIGDRMVMGEGAKSGDYHVVDAETGAEIWSKRVSSGGFIGGFLGSTAYADGRIHAVINNTVWINDPRLPFPPTGGVYVSLSAENGQILHWEPMLPSLSSPCVAGGVVYYTDVAGTIWARNAKTGLVQWTLPTGELSASGPAVSRGSLYVGTGAAKGFAFGGTDPPSLAHHLYAIDIDGL